MKVAMIHDYFPNEEHGIYTHTHNLVKELIKKHEIEQLYVITPTTCKLKEDKNSNFLKNLFPNYFSIPKKIKKRIYELKPDIVHIHGTHPPYSVLPFILKNCKIIVTLHGIVSIDSKNSIKNRLYFKNYLYSYLEKSAIKKADKVIAVSPAVKDIIEKKGVVASKISIIPNGINIDEYESTKRIENIYHPSILFIGRLVKQKGVDILIKSLPIVKESIHGVHLYIAGSGPQYKKLNTLVDRLDLKDNITFLGYVQGQQKRSYYKSVDLCIVPSTFEAHPLVILEAMASGKPVIASNVGGIPYIVDDGETGFLFESRNYHELATKIIEILANDKLREKMGISAKRKVEQFSWTYIADETIKVYEKTLKE